MKFSVVIPLYNKAPYVRKALESVIAQTYQNFELMVVDDGSTDGSTLIVDEFLNGIENIKHRFIKQENLGVSIARNNGVAHSDGDYIAFLDADDWWDCTYLERMAQFINEYPDAGLYACNYYYHKNNKNLIRVSQISTGYINYPKVYYDIFAMPVWTGATIIPRSVFLDVNGFNPQLWMSEDFDLWIRIALKYKVCFLNELLAYYNQSVQLKWRALGKLYPPHRQFAFNADYLLTYQKEDEDIRHVVDMVKILCLKQYYISKQYHELAKKELSKIDINNYQHKFYASYLWQPLWKLKLEMMIGYIYQLITRK